MIATEIAVTLIASGTTLAGVLVAQWVALQAQRKDSAAAHAEDAAERARERQKIHDRFNRLEEKQEALSKKLDKHNGFEGRIIRLEAMADIKVGGTQ